MKPFLTFAIVALLTACGADGAPEAPASMSSSEPGVSVSGCVSAGVVYGAPTNAGGGRC